MRAFSGCGSKRALMMILGVLLAACGESGGGVRTASQPGQGSQSASQVQAARERATQEVRALGAIEVAKDCVERTAGDVRREEERRAQELQQQTGEPEPVVDFGFGPDETQVLVCDFAGTFRSDRVAPYSWTRAVVAIDDPEVGVGLDLFDDEPPPIPSAQ